MESPVHPAKPWELFFGPAENRDGLKERLRKFYNSCRDYTAFQAPSDQDQPWERVVEHLRARHQPGKGRRWRVLEVGAGRSGFAGYLAKRGLRREALLHAQDVTSANEGWLRQEFDEVTVGDLGKVAGDFDIVFSTYVFEHSAEPESLLEQMWQRTAPGGSLFLFCPRYDLPFYLSRGADHLSGGLRIGAGLYLLWRRWRTWITGRPAWLVQKDPAVFHLPFFRDRDAVHWVSWWDVRARFPEARRLPLPPRGWAEWIRLRWLTISCRIDRPTSSGKNGP